MAERTGPWTGPGTAAGACALAPSDELGSSAARLPLPIRERARMAAALDAPHRPVYLPPSVFPRVVGIGNFFVCLFRAAIGTPDGFGRPPLRIVGDARHPVPVHTSRDYQLHFADGRPRRCADCSRAHVRG